MNRSYTKSNEPTNQASHQPIAYHFYEDTLSSFPESVLKEWSLTNGIGGYGGGSINGALGRTHHGYLIASLHHLWNAILHWQRQRKPYRSAPGPLTWTAIFFRMTL